jgi:hypothetical protein
MTSPVAVGREWDCSHGILYVQRLDTVSIGASGKRCFASKADRLA